MNINLLYAALTQQEKDDLFHLLAEERIPANTKDLTTVKKFVEKHKAVISSRLQNILTREIGLDKYIEHIESSKLLMCRNMGKYTQLEFIRLRGF